jgi:hypothetical protein
LAIGRYAFGATVGPALAGTSNELGGLAAYVWLEVCIGKSQLLRWFQRLALLSYSCRLRLCLCRFRLCLCRFLSAAVAVVLNATTSCIMRQRSLSNQDLNGLQQKLIPSVLDGECTHPAHWLRNRSD